jgi:hypothetical protein
MKARGLDRSGTAYLCKSQWELRVQRRRRGEEAVRNGLVRLRGEVESGLGLVWV